VLYLQSTSEIGGSDISLLRIVESLDKQRFRPYVVLPADGPLVPTLRAHGSEVFLLGEMLKLTTRRGPWYALRYCVNYPRAVLRLAALIRRERIDLVHTNTLHNVYGWAAARLSGRPHVWHVREIVFQSGLARALESHLARFGADRVVVTSDAVGGLFRDGRGEYPRRVRKIANGVDVEVYHPANDGGRVRNDLGVAPDTPLVGLVCRLDRWKGVEIFLQAAAISRGAAPEVRYVVVGGAIEGHEDYPGGVRALAAALGVEDIVSFTGWRYGPEEMPGVHAALDVLVVASSLPEPFGLVVLEAMATGKPVVATAHGGPAEIVVDGETGLLVPPRDAERMAAALVSLIAEPERARAMGRAGRERVERLYGQTACVRALEGLYREILEG
jgi:glycosyltransferase involved in cell wall biosynthesis